MIKSDEREHGNCEEIVPLVQIADRVWHYEKTNDWSYQKCFTDPCKNGLLFLLVFWQHRYTDQNQSHLGMGYEIDG